MMIAVSGTTKVKIMVSPTTLRVILVEYSTEMMRFLENHEKDLFKVLLAVQPEMCHLIKVISYSLKHMLHNNYTRLVTAIFCKVFKRGLFQYKGEQPKNF